MSFLSKYGIFGRGAILSGAVLAALTVPSFFKEGCVSPTAPEVNLESTYVAEKDSSRLEELMGTVNFSSSELSSWRSQYLTQGDRVLDNSELLTMAEYFFFNNAYQFANFGPNFVPLREEFNVVNYNLNGSNGPEAVIDWNGDKYTFKVSKDLTSAGLYRSK